MGNLIQIQEFCADFFVTGNNYVRDALDLKFIPRANLCNDDNEGGLILDDANQNLQDGYLIANLNSELIPCNNLCENYMVEDAILADDKQNLQQSYLIAKSVFERTKSNTIKFVLIGLSPYNFPTNSKEPPTICPVEEKVLDDYLKLCVDNGAKPVVIVLPVHSALKKNYNADVLKLFRNTINKVVKKREATVVDLLDVALPNNLFQNIYRLNSEGAAAVSVLLSEKLYIKGILSPQDLCAADNDFFKVFSKYFPRDTDFPNDDKPLIHRVFCLMACEDFNRLSKIMPKENCMDLMTRVFSELTYSYLANLADIFPKDDYNELMTRIFKITIKNIRCKDKIKVGFYFDFSSHWLGDDLYNVFAKDERFEPAIFFPIDGWYGDEFNRNEYRKDLNKFKARGLNVLEMKKDDIPERDILFRLRPYPEYIPPAFRLTNLKVKETLVIYIAYALHVSLGPQSYPLQNVSWKRFFSSIIEMDEGKKKNKFGTPRGIYSGYPKQDIFFKPDAKFHFDWKMARPDAKKIIWAPHWSIAAGAFYATFQWNYEFMYEFAKAHTEISWVVKPHPLLLQATRWSGFFKSNEVVKAYFQKWDELPNAQFYTGTYYQDIFATSDGMIHDSGSFIAEYQYVDKPMIYLTRDTQRFNELGTEILKASYTVDGKDLDAIAAMMQRVFIEGDDYKAAQRKEVFDKYLNYPKANGMLASEFIYKNIADELKEESK